ncbi:hypothetical protein QQF64_020427 [Cirrhinus molitorella]|uniref:Reverse transcriptase/retrotransposon-derived protein RNase H-like domain-containing protein n=1 Tax=Cirrhinus molitorella TaxID=172907 RepID=A0ABR3L954_9TELE
MLYDLAGQPPVRPDSTNSMNSQGCQLATPLTALTSTKTPFMWPSAAEAAFTELKGHFVSAPILWAPDPTRQFVVGVDASEVGRCHRTWTRARETLLRVGACSKVKADRHRSKPPVYVVGQKVWLSTKNIGCCPSFRLVWFPGWWTPIFPLPLVGFPEEYFAFVLLIASLRYPASKLSLDYLTDLFSSVNKL